MQPSGEQLLLYQTAAPVGDILLLELGRNFIDLDTSMRDSFVKTMKRMVFIACWYLAEDLGWQSNRTILYNTIVWYVDAIAAFKAKKEKFVQLSSS